MKAYRIETLLKIRQPKLIEDRQRCYIVPGTFTLGEWVDLKIKTVQKQYKTVNNEKK